MAEWNENKLEQELDAMMQEMPETKDLEKQIIKSINQKVRKIVVRTVAVILACLMLIFLIISPIMDMIYFNPKKLYDDSELTMYRVMDDYIETVMPYRVMTGGMEIKSQGFGRYELSMGVHDLTEGLPLVTISGPNVWCEINKGKYENLKDSEGIFTYYPGRFDYTWPEAEDLIESFKKLPESAMIYLSVSGTEERTLEELRTLPVTLAWGQLYQPNVEFQGGINLEEVFHQEEIGNGYPRKYMTEDDLLRVYLSNLNNLLEHEEVWADFGLCDGTDNYFVNSSREGTLEKVKETLEDAKKLTRVYMENYSVYGKRDEVIQFLEENTLDSIYVERVSLWRMD